MFQLTREFIINDNGVAGGKGLLKSGKRFEVKDDTLLVARMINLKKDCIVSASKVAGAAAVNEKVTITPSAVTIAKGEIVRLVVTISQQGRVISLVNDYHPLHKKEYFYEAAVATANTLPLDAFEAIAAKEEAVEAPDRLIHISKSGSDLVVEALDQYTRIDEVRIVHVPKTSATPVAEILTGYMDWDALVLWKKAGAVAEGCSATLVAGSEGAGTVAQILKNKRLLTDANIDPYGFDLDERPVPGALYDQYLIEYVTERRHIGSQVFGAIDQSLLSVVFFVRANATCEAEDVSSEFAAALDELGVTVESLTLPAESPEKVDDAETLPKEIVKKNKAAKESEDSSASA